MKPFEPTVSNIYAYSSHIMSQENKLPMLCGHVVVRLQDSIVVFGGSQLVSPCGYGYALEVQSLILNVIWVYELYTDLWRKYVISESEKAPPSYRTCMAWKVRSDNQDRYLYVSCAQQ